MLGSAGGNSGFDAAFLAIEVAGIVLWLIALILAGRMAVRTLWLFGVLDLLLVVGVPVFWYLGYPAAHGIERAARLLFLVPLIAANFFLFLFLCYRVRSMGRPG